MVDVYVMVEDATEKIKFDDKRIYLYVEKWAYVGDFPVDVVDSLVPIDEPEGTYATFGEIKECAEDGHPVARKVIEIFELLGKHPRDDDVIEFKIAH